MQKLGGSFLEKLLTLDSGHRGPRVACGQDHQAEFLSYRAKTVDTVLGSVQLRRAWYHCATCGHGRAPRDQELGVAEESLSPGLRRMMARVGSQEPFAHGRRDLAELAGIQVTTKRVERSAEKTGTQVRAAAEAEAEALLSGQVIPLTAAAPPPKLYVAIDGTGVPMIPRETEGRRGKGEDGRAHTREAKLGCLFTQTAVDDQGRPVRDPDSSSYVSSFESVERFGPLVYAEALRRGVEAAGQVIVLGDGAPWIWNLAAEHFPRAIEIVDLYHAREHLTALSHDLSLPDDDPSWLADRRADLDRGDLDAMIAAVEARPGGDSSAVAKALGYFETNRTRMRYGRFRQLGVFVGSGSVEAGCKCVVHQRMKLSGMRWSLRGATGIVSLRCLSASGRWDDIWKWLHTQTISA